jgi:hypothetical protein
MRRFEIPDKMQKRFGYPALGEADGKIKNMIFGENSARLYGIDPADYPSDNGAKIPKEPLS